MGLFKNWLGKDECDEYVEIDLNAAQANDNSKVVVKPFVLREFDDINPILNSLQRGLHNCSY